MVVLVNLLLDIVLFNGDQTPTFSCTRYEIELRFIEQFTISWHKKH